MGVQASDPEVTFSSLGPASSLVEGQLTPIYPASAFFPSAARVKAPGLGAVATTLPGKIGPGGSAAGGMTMGGGAAEAQPAALGGGGSEVGIKTGGQQSVNIMGQQVPLLLIYIVAFTLAAYLVLHYIHFGGSAEIGGGS